MIAVVVVVAVTLAAASPARVRAAVVTTATATTIATTTAAITTAMMAYARGPSGSAPRSIAASWGHRLPCRCEGSGGQRAAATHGGFGAAPSRYS